jgi:Flp pilus assembly protein TadD
MMPKRSPLVVGLLLLALLGGCRPNTNLPTRSSPQYNELVRTFYIGLAALQVGHDVQADTKLAQFTQLAPAEPAGWANWGLLALRQRNYDIAAERINKARDLTPENSDIFYLLGLLESSRGNTPEAIKDLRKSVELDQNNLIATYKLAEEIERQGDEKSAQEFQSLIEKILTVQPDNIAALIELTRIAAKRGDRQALDSTVGKIVSRARSSSWPEEVLAQVSALGDATKAGDTVAVATRTSFLRNVLVRVPEYRRDLAEIKPPPGEEATPFTHFLKLETPVFTAAAADTEITFKPEWVTAVGTGPVDWIGAISLSGSGAPVIATATAKEVRLVSGATFPFPGGTAKEPPTINGILPVDFSYDFKTDLVLAGAGGLRFMRQDSPTAFTDVTNQTKLAPATLSHHYFGAWAADIEADGDLDIVLASTYEQPLVLRNNGDGSFTEIKPFAGVSGSRGFAWADLDADGDPDAAIIDDTYAVHVFSNERQGQFTERAIPANLNQFASAINVMDVNNDGVLDLLLATNDGKISSLSDKDQGAGWIQTEIAKRPEPIADELAGALKFAVADLDNNGGLDLVLIAPGFAFNRVTEKCAVPCKPGVYVWLGDGKGKFTFLPDATWQERVFDVADVNGDGRLDLLGLSLDGKPREAINQGTKNYHWQIVRPRATKAVGDQRINPFGVGGEMEIRSGLLVQKQPITGPLLHFGLGEQTSADVIRVVWPNGTVRADFEVKADQEVVTEQRLKGSCPFLFAYNGKQMEFVKDAVPWSSAIGLRINTLGTARVEATEEWYKIGRDQLVPHDGYYDLRITAELWETYYYDHLSLMVVDHPENTDIFVDERFVIPAAKLEVTTVSAPRKIMRAIDERGQDVTNLVNALDGNYLGTFERGKYQGVARDHYVELDLGAEAPSSGPLWLIANGWMHPTDSSINVAISQGQEEQAKPLSLEIPDGRGGWQVVRANMGFPAGRKKICLFDLTDVFKPGIPRRLRLRSNLEIYWDSLEWAVGLTQAELKITRLNPEVADLHYRGYSVINQKDDSSPEVPDYNRLSSSKQIWRDLIGYYTRFGDVRELLLQADDRYVIMNAGDEMTFRFAEQPAPPRGWVRDYVIVGDGWIKDGDYNSTFSKTVLPLPYHAKNQYITAPGKLEEEMAYRQHPEDWQNYHTRYVTAGVFQNALRLKQKK